jgi:hypothetical protein
MWKEPQLESSRQEHDAKPGRLCLQPTGDRGFESIPLQRPCIIFEIASRRHGRSDPFWNRNHWILLSITFSKAYRNFKNVRGEF